MLFLTALLQHNVFIPLYPAGVPNSIHKDAIDKGNVDNSVFYRVVNPALRIYLPQGQQVKRTAVIICAGGGYAELNIKREGYTVAEAFNRIGVAAFVLKYRLPDDKTNKDKTIAPLQDAQQAIKMVRDSAEKWNIDPGKIGIMGFSAGGHLASSSGTHFNKVTIPNPAKTSVRPDFMILVYPVISFNNSIGHIGSRNNLLGTAPSADSVNFFSNELHTDEQTPPSFLVHAGDDKVVSVSNSIKFYEALNRNGVPADLHIYAKGGHGFGATPTFDEWFTQCTNWMKSNQWISSY
ncbi:MAG: esterase/lipase-like protein [Segetibacter sp.]|nr:esterase/lipase-like protein [Segetibacter sp.]